MMKTCLMGTLYTCVFTLITTSTHAAFFGRLETSPGSGIYQAYYDDQLDITWTANANINGEDTWENQTAWAASLNINGVTGWRLPNMDLPGNDVPVDCAVVAQATCRGNEYGHLFYYGAGTILRNGITPTNPGPFNSVQASGYWSSNTLPSDPDKALGFDFIDGIFFIGGKVGNVFAWAVHNGDVGITNVTVDIKPSKKPANVISLKKDKNLKVAIVGSESFDALQVDPTTVRFGSSPNEASPIRFKGQDYNRDGYSDLILTFKLSQTGIACNVDSATLTGQTSTDPVLDIVGSDSFTVEPCP